MYSFLFVMSISNCCYISLMNNLELFHGSERNNAATDSGPHRFGPYSITTVNNTLNSKCPNSLKLHKWKILNLLAQYNFAYVIST